MAEPQSIYAPILRAKAGELQALGNLDAAVKPHVRPLLEVQSIADPGSKTLEQHFANLASDLASKWGTEHRILIDDEESGDTGANPGTHPLVALFDLLATSAVRAVPVTGFKRSVPYKDAVAKVAAKTGSICLRLEPDDFITDTAPVAVTEWLAETGFAPTTVDLVLDLGSLPANEKLLGLAVKGALASIPSLAAWKSLTLAMTSFPIALADHVSPGSTGRIPRRAWGLYAALRAGSLPRVPDFGDYAVDNPETVLDIPPALLGARMTASIRYSTNADWLILRGTNLRRDGYEQYHDVSKRLMAEPEYCGPSFSWGDEYISKCAAGSVGSGNQTTWRTVAVNHHITLVVEQLSTLP